ncbi:hypothetical protein CYMTET_12326 [Cymbomonas tetramitiformis]|uniref:Reverse transcriptase domain-containing protein n=1 Tax=Cymbomonas tetramitiformis TaxID=36881 RepID=A0AAE0GKM5_9CHLO|nr:hypothetical protein CYMTET_12326 [Cymbomonas tetramitiformis]
MQWITHGVKLRWKRGPPPPFDHGVSLRDATRQQQVWLDAEKERLLQNGAWTRATRRSHVSRAFLVPKPGTNKWRLVVDFRWLNQWCVKNRVKMETLKKLRRLAKPGDWCFSFDLQDGFHALGIHPDFQRFMQFDLQGDLLQCSAVPFGWNDAPRVFSKFVRVMVEALRSAQAAEDRREIRRLRDGSAVRQRWSVRRRAGGVGENANRHSGMRVLPYMDDFLVLVDSQREGFLRREKFNWRLAFFTGLCQSVYLAVLAARLYLRELYFVLAEKRVGRQPFSLRGFGRLETQSRLVRVANKQWGPYTVDLFASEISAQLPRYYAAWKDPRCEGVDSLTYDWRGENNWVNPPWALLDEVAHKLREEGAVATVVAPYWPGQSWFRELEALATEVVIMPRRRDLFTPSRLGGSELLRPSKRTCCTTTATRDLSEENFKIINSVSELTDEAADADGENIENIENSGGDYEENKRGGAVQNFLTRSLCERWRSELGQSRLTELAVTMQRKALLDTTMSNYGPKAQRFILFCEQHQRPWLPASEVTVLFYIASLLKDGGIKSASLQPYLSAINNYHEDLRFPGPAKGRAVTRAVKGMATIQAELAVQEENIETQRTWLPAAHVRRVHEAALKLTPRSPEELRLLRAFAYVVVAFVTFGRPDTGTSLSRQHVHCGDSEFSVVLLKEKGRRHHLVKRRLCIPWKGVALLKELIEHWEFHRDTAWSRSENTQLDAYWLLPEDPKNFKASVANDWIGLALSELDCRPPEGGHFSAHNTRKGATTCARVVGVAMEKVCFFGGWSQFSSAVQHYIDPTALRDADMHYYFEWLTWS